MPHPFFTIGHSTRTVTTFVELLQACEVGLVADVRSVPRSRANPQFNRDALPECLAEFQIGYAHLPALGGLRGRQRGLDLSPNPFWKVRSFRNYADYALSPSFSEGLAELRQLGRARPTAIMCAEAVWWRCHRRIIADYLIAAGEHVFHILGPKQVARAQMTAGALSEKGAVTYPDAAAKNVLSTSN